MRELAMGRAIWAGPLALVVGLLCMPVQLHAKEFVNPWGGVVFGNGQATTGFHSFGIAVGDAGHGLLGTETNIGFSPGFFGAGVDNYVLDLMAGVTVGPTLATKSKRDIRPYLLAGAGTVRTKIGKGEGATFARNNIALSLGGGAMLEMSDRLAVRGDVRYLRALRSEDAANGLDVNLADFHYWRASLGLTIH
jgi:Outer membrane protein beta-barrel domain